MVDLAALALRVRSDVETYVVPERHPEQVGSPLPSEWFEAGLAQMRAALVEPYWVEMLDGEEALRKVAVVADDSGHALVAFDPLTEEFVLGGWHDGRLGSWNVRGDAVGCFLAR